MKKNVKSLLFVCVCMLLCFSFLFQPVSAMETRTDDTSYTIDTPYTYPVLPGSTEWAAFDSLEEKIEACAVDEDLLESMTTPALLETVINYPLLINIYAFDSIDRGFASVSEYFKGIEILLDRENASTYIQSALQTETYSEYDTDATIKEGYLQAIAHYMNASHVSQSSSRISTPGGSTLEL